MKKTTRCQPVLQPRFRVAVGEEIALGPGKIRLLEAIVATGSLNQAAKELEMSYMRAWLLVKTMNSCFRDPLVSAERGGKSGGGAHLTENGLRVLHLYREIHDSALKATIRPWRDLEKLLRT